MAEERARPGDVDDVAAAVHTADEWTGIPWRAAQAHSSSTRGLRDRARAGEGPDHGASPRPSAGGCGAAPPAPAPPRRCAAAAGRARATAGSDHRARTVTRPGATTAHGPGVSAGPRPRRRVARGCAQAPAPCEVEDDVRIRAARAKIRLDVAAVDPARRRRSARLPVDAGDAAPSSARWPTRCSPSVPAAPVTTARAPDHVASTDEPMPPPAGACKVALTSLTGGGVRGRCRSPLDPGATPGHRPACTSAAGPTPRRGAPRCRARSIALRRSAGPSHGTSSSAHVSVALAPARAWSTPPPSRNSRRPAELLAVLDRRRRPASVTSRRRVLDARHRSSDGRRGHPAEHHAEHQPDDERGRRSARCRGCAGAGRPERTAPLSTPVPR